MAHYISRERNNSYARNNESKVECGSCQIGGSQRGPKSWKMEAEEAMALGPFTRRQPVKTQQTKKSKLVL
jgi:hypothetical protein